MKPVFASILIGVALLILAHPAPQPPLFEGKDYLMMAQGRSHEVYYYYAGRILHPLVVREIVQLWPGLSYDAAFRWLSYGSLIVLFGVTALYLTVAAGPEAAWLALPLLVTPVLITELGYYYFPDLFFYALCAVFLLTLRYSLWLSLPLLLLLHLTRESALLLTLVLIIVSFRAGRKVFAAAVLAVGLSGMAITNHLVRAALPNKHGLPTMLFDFLKMLYNASHLLGLQFWTDTNAVQIARPPLWVIQVNFGAIREIGFSGFDFTYSISTLMIMASAFGVLPFYLFVRRGLLSRASLDQRTAAAYGALAFAMTPLMGDWIGRYVLYAFPLFWMIGPLTLVNERPARSLVLIASFIAIWIPWLLDAALALRFSLTTGVVFEPPKAIAIALWLGLEVAVYLVTSALLVKRGDGRSRCPA